MRDYSTHSFWLEDSGEPLTPRPALKSSRDVDVAILGGGYSGLWTAYYLLHEPALRVAMVERRLPATAPRAATEAGAPQAFRLLPGHWKRFGAEAARNLLLNMRASVDEMRRVCGEENRCAVPRAAADPGPRRSPVTRSLKSAAYESLGLADR